jgi:hypothetical protein
MESMTIHLEETMYEVRQRAATWYRPSMVFAGVMAVMAVVSLGGLVFDDRVLLGAPIWLKPFKFAVSIALYMVTWAWMTSLLEKGKRLARYLSLGLVAALIIEYAIIVTQVIRGRASHFNSSTPLDSALYKVMGVTIGVLWVGTLILTVLLFRTPIKDKASRWGVRLGGVLALAGLSLGFLMVSPTAMQRAAMKSDSFDGVVGAHSVGVADGGPVMPITGWSTTGGDLRIPHFVGMHALQALPLFVLLLAVLATRFPRLRGDDVRARLVLIAAAGYAGLVGLVTWQALRAQSLIHPDALTLGALAVLIALVSLGALLGLRSTKDSAELVSTR